MYDIIGDIHGYADELKALLERLDYSKKDGCYRHAERKVIFVGDFIDRGPQIAEVLELVRAMHEADAALSVMGNHEFNALAFHTPDLRAPGKFLRPHIEKNLKQHGETLRQLSESELQSYLGWFRSLPMWLDLGDLRVVHACWDDIHIAVMKQKLKEHGGVTDEFLLEATTVGSELFEAVDDVLKGKDIWLPEGMTYDDKDGNPRRKIRVKWFHDPQAHTLATYAMTHEYELPENELDSSVIDRARPYGSNEPPVLFGHYWFRHPRPHRLAANVACVDYSVAKHGLLCAYRWSGERELLDDHFVWVPARR